MSLSKPDNFYSPKNENFYQKDVYGQLKRRGLNTNDEFRLLEIEPTRFVEGELTCKMITVFFEDFKDKYATLSYCAGDATKTRAMMVNGERFNAFATLWESISQAWRYWASIGSKEARYLWADQVCINQSNLGERTHQVGLMGLIYRNSLECLVYFPSHLGSAASNGVEFLEKVGKSTKWELDPKLQLESGGSFVDQDGTLQVAKDDWARVHEMINHEWWYRAWVQQEFLLSPHLLVVDRSKIIRWLDLEEALTKLRQTEVVSSLRPTEENPAKRMYHLRSEATRANLDWVGETCRLKGQLHEIGGSHTPHYESAHLEWFLSRAGFFRATDARDKIYSLMGLSSPKYAIEADYGPAKTSAIVVIDISRRIVEIDGNLNLLYATIGDYIGSPAADVPSWAPDWTAKRDFQTEFKEATAARKGFWRNFFVAGRTEFWERLLRHDSSGPSIGSQKPLFTELEQPQTGSSHVALTVRGLCICGLERFPNDDPVTSSAHARLMNKDDAQKEGALAYEIWALENLEDPIVLDRFCAGDNVFRIPQHPQGFFRSQRQFPQAESWYRSDFYQDGLDKRSWVTISII